MGSDRPFRLMIVAGEASGDLHASHLVAALRRRRPDLVAYGFGGERMAAAGVELAARLTDHQAIGYFEILRALPAGAYHYWKAARMLDQRRPDALVVVDFPTFNVPLAERACQRKVPVYYFIPPKVWGWKSERAPRIARASTKVFAIFPFEPDYFTRSGGRAFYFGHPLVDFVRPSVPRPEFRARHGWNSERPLVTLLPGSRRQEIAAMLTIYLEVARRLSDRGLAAQFAIPRAHTVPREWLEEPLASPAFASLAVRILDEGIHDCLAASTLALATCGTVTLEAAICGCPMVISYNAGVLTRWLFRGRHRFTYFGLPNIVAGREICPERVGEAADPETLFETAAGLLSDPQALATQREELRAVTARLGEPGVFDKVAAEILRAESSPHVETVTDSATGAGPGPGATPGLAPREAGPDFADSTADGNRPG
ncbi:MAG: lipid-A-disaccharide synthase [Candidatus Riflebacteria bacterium]|nr:lipid-A-disaccharide synthase [Candidatus Riflebacteria bacterium]